MRDGLLNPSEEVLSVWTGTAVLYRLTLYTQALLQFTKATRVAVVSQYPSGLAVQS